MWYGFDCGAGGLKVRAAGVSLQVLSQVAVNGGTHLSKVSGLRTRAEIPVNIVNEGGSFYVGQGAHAFGRAVENLGYDRLTGSPEMLSLFHAALTKIGKREVSLRVGVPVAMLDDAVRDGNVASIRKWMVGQHEWTADGESRECTVAEIQINAQAVGALMDYVMNADGSIAHASALKTEVGIVSPGFNTLELMVVDRREVVPAMTRGVTVGVRRLLELVDPNGLYSKGELDTKLRRGRLDVSKALPIWEAEIAGAIEQAWGGKWKRFETILIVGGGAVLLAGSLPYRFAGKAIVPNDPVFSIANGLWKMSAKKA